MKRVVCRQLNLFMKELVRLGNETPIVRVFEIDVDITRECAVLVTNHGGAVGERCFRHLSERNLRSRGSSNENASHSLCIVTEISLVADIDGIAFAALDVFSDVLST